MVAFHNNDSDWSTDHACIYSHFGHWFSFSLYSLDVKIGKNYEIQLKMTTIQERLQLKRAPVDKWTTREKLCLASAVFTSGDQNWMNVSRSLKVLCNNTTRPSDWYSQKSCAAQYGDLLENADTPKRKKRTSSENAVTVTPTEAVLKRLTDERISEIRMQIQKDQEEYAKIDEEIDALENGDLSDAQLMEMWKAIEAEQVQKIIDQEKYVQMLKDREEKKLEMQRQWKPTIHINKTAIASTSKTEVEDMDIDESITPQSLPQPPSSPLLTSLLKSGQGPPASVASPTITHLLIGGIPSTSTSQASVLTQQPPRTSLAIPDNSQKPSVAPTPSQTAPTLSLLLKKKEEQVVNSGGNDSLNKDEEQQLLEVFNGLIPDNIDELAEMITKNSDIMLEGEEGLDSALLEDPEASRSPALPKEVQSNEKEGENEQKPEATSSEEKPEVKPEVVISSDESSDNTNLQALKDKSEESLALKEEKKEQDIEEIKEEHQDPEKPETEEETHLIEIPIDMKCDDPETMLELIHQSPEPEEKQDEDVLSLQPSKFVRKLRERDRSESPLIDDDGATDSSTSFRSRRRYSSTPVNDSHPNSPVPSSLDDKETKAFKKSMFLLCTRLEKSEYSGVFNKATPDGSLEDILKWKNVCLKLLDLPTLRKNVESGHTKTTAEFFRDIYVMCYNFILFYRENNKSSQGTHKQAVKFLEEVRDLEKESKEGRSMEKDTFKERSNTSSSSKSRSRKSQRF